VSAYVVRDMRPDERDRVVELTRAAYAEFEEVMSDATWKGFSGAMDSVLDDSGDGQIIVVDDGYRIVGSVFYFGAGTRAYGDDPLLAAPEFRLLAVDPHGRGRGVGRALVEECIRRAKASGSRELGLHTSKSFASAVAMYQQMGFARVPERDFHPPGGEVVEGYRLGL